MCYFVSFTASERKLLDLYRALIEGRNRENFVDTAKIIRPHPNEVYDERSQTSVNN